MQIHTRYKLRRSDGIWRPWGVCLHTTGRTVGQRAREAGQEPIDRILRLYAEGRAWPHYVVDTDGAVWQTGELTSRAAHAGIAPAQLQLYQSGAWRQKVSAAALYHWERRWPGKTSPVELYPGLSPNTSLVGIELVPLPAISTAPGQTWYTPLQYARCAALIDFIAGELGFSNPRHIGNENRLLLHEDVEPLERWDASGGWDPGYLRDGVSRRFWLEGILLVPPTDTRDPDPVMS